MQNKNGQIQQLGICHRLFNFLMHSLVSRGLKRVTLGPRKPETEVLIEDSPGLKNKVISFKTDTEQDDDWRRGLTGHDRLENWTPIDELGSSVLLPERIKKRMSSEKELPLMDSDGNYSDHQMINIKSKLRKEKMRINLEGGGDHREDGDSRIYTPPRLRPLFRVEANINEKSSEFIQKRKEAMRRNLEP